MEVIQLLSKFIREDYPQHTGAFLDMLEAFGQRLSELFG
jgi:hypothetical protein